jgi:hypothetical protein
VWKSFTQAAPPFRQSGFTIVDFLSAADQGNNHCPLRVPVHDGQDDFRLRQLRAGLLGVMGRIPCPLRFVEDNHVLGGRLVRLGERIADEGVDVLDEGARRSLASANRGIMALATRLYVDTATQRVKRGAGGKSGGSARRLSDVIEQFDLTWDLYAAAVEELVAVMPREFERFLR